MLETQQARPRAEKPRKWHRILKVLAEGATLTRFDAEQLGDHCLHSTVAALEHRGVEIHRQQVVVPGRFGVVHCKRYRLAPLSMDRARELLAVKPA